MKILFFLLRKSLLTFSKYFPHTITSTSIPTPPSRAHITTEFAKLSSQNTISLTVESLGSWWEAECGSKWMRFVETAITRYVRTCEQSQCGG